ncbi:hypothetical protein HS7_15460 [Sulfolobales archaeon HS-7]|nr:hypothetical protein HS7_15460 [Sulfolobales archaeon HS-7]
MRDRYRKKEVSNPLIRCIPKDEVKNNVLQKELIGNTFFVIYKSDSRIWVISPCCPHKGADMSKGKVENETITCYMHGYVYDLNTGVPLKIPYGEAYGKWRETGNLEVYKPTIRDNQICLDLP